ncbi:TetR/AcrR family transcriptional regulator [Nocardia noduli]|uniref:TetR/AcrR family transcriptional regulator n=1 Tax=Nocardia noduli TaxID=2815722 RepID=UPI0027DEE436|nr:TetR/AcrR family transcriptional regulator [Nocardia noduli]
MIIRSRLVGRGGAITTGQRRPGRPTRTETRQLVERLREAAVETFLACGYDGTTMEAIARAAGITKQTLYARYPDKRAVFAEVIPWAMSRRDSRASSAPPEGADLRESLTAIGREALARVADPHLVKLQRIAMSESARFPEFALSAETMAWSPRLRAVMDVLRRHRDAGELDIADDELDIAAEHFLVLVEAQPWRLAEFGVYRSDEQTERHLRYAITLFLRGVEPRSGGSG